MSYRTVCRLIAAVILFSLLVRWRAFSLTGGLELGGVSTLVSVLTLVTLVLALASVAGIWAARTWGFVAFYPFSVLFTVLFGASLIPFVTLLVPAEERLFSVLVVNGIALALVTLVHHRHPG